MRRNMWKWQSRKIDSFSFCLHNNVSHSFKYRHINIVVDVEYADAYVPKEHLSTMFEAG